MNWKEHPWMGVFPATLCAFHEDETIDEDGLRTYIDWLCNVEGLKGLVCNGHTGEITSLRAWERAQVTRIFVDEVKKCKKALKVISGVSAEGSLEAIDQAIAAKESGANGILLMPPHHWLRFGRSSQTAVSFIRDVAEGADISIIVHQYPAWTKASYALTEMLEMVKIPQVVCIKMGTRDMARWLYDYEMIKKAAPHMSVVTCHDEYVLPTLLEAGDGALIGMAGFAPELMVKLVHACIEGDLKTAKDAQKMAAPLVRLIYDFGEPGGGAHQRMKVGLWLLGKFPSPVFRRPHRPLSDDQINGIRKNLREIGFKTVH